MHTMTFTSKCVVLAAVICLFYSEAQGRVLVTRANSWPAPDSNNVTLMCRDEFSLEVTNPVFYLNDTRQDLRDLLGSENYREMTNSLTFAITRELEGNYFCGREGQSSVISNEGAPLIAYPLPEALQMVTITAVAGRNAVLPPLISPGALIQQYFIDWQDATSSVTLARIQGPRSQMTFVPNERYSVSPDTFALTINSVRFEDRGSYLGVIGAREPTSGGQGLTFTQSQTLTESVTLEVILPPTFVESPLDTVTNSNSTTFSCTVQGYPQPAISWHHDGRYASSPNKYRMEQTVSEEAPFVVESTLTILDLSSQDSGNVTCVAMVTTDEGESLVEQRTSHLSVLGDLAGLRTFVTVTQGVILRVNLVRALAAEVQLFVRYTDTESGETANQVTPFSYNTQSLQLAFFDESVPYQRFTVQVALTAGSLMGPLYQDPIVYDLSQPTELNTLLSTYILPWCFGLLVLLIVVTSVIIIACTLICRRLCLQCCLKANSQGTVAAAIVDRMLELNVLRGDETLGKEDVQGGPPPLPASKNYDEIDGPTPIPQQANSGQTGWKTFVSYFSCCETAEERMAKDKLNEIKRSLQQSVLQEPAKLNILENPV